MKYLFTSESVSEGHPDKVCDQVSDAILDAFLEKDQYSRVACECFTTTGTLVVGGEISSRAKGIDIQQIVRNTIKDIGYTKSDYRFDAESCSIPMYIHSQSGDIAMGVDRGGAGDQGMMFGYATDESREYMPLPIMYAHKLVQRLAYIRKREPRLMPYLRPDAKSQVTVEYDDRTPLRVTTIVISTQHDPDVSQKQIARDIKKHVVPAVIPAKFLKGSKFFINPTGKFEIGGPHGDTGLTGRKIIVDTYGGRAPHGGGAFSGKDPTKVDRSAAYAARHIAKNIVAAGLANECLIQVAYAIGIAQPVSILVNTYGTGRIADDLLAKIVAENVDMTPRGIIERLKLRRPIYKKTAAYGHFGRNDKDFTWEKVDLVPVFRKAAKRYL